MDIVVLDGYTLNPGDLSWKDLKSLGTLTVYDKTAADSIFERAKEAEIVLTNKTVLTREIIETLPKLRYIGVLATGYNTVDIDAAGFCLHFGDGDANRRPRCRRQSRRLVPVRALLLPCGSDYGIERKNAGDYRIRKHRQKNGGNRRRLRNGNRLRQPIAENGGLAAFEKRAATAFGESAGLRRFRQPQRSANRSDCPHGE